MERVLLVDWNANLGRQVHQRPVGNSLINTMSVRLKSKTIRLMGICATYQCPYGVPKPQSP